MAMKDFKDTMEIPAVMRMMIEKLKSGFATKGHSLTDEDMLVFMALFAGLALEGIPPMRALEHALMLTLTGSENVEELILQLNNRQP